MTTQNQTRGIPFETALKNLRAKTPELNGTLPDKETLLKTFHPDHAPSARTVLPVGANDGGYCHPELAKLLTAQPLLEDYDLAGAENMETDVLVIGGGGAGAAAALTAAAEGARVVASRGERGAVVVRRRGRADECGLGSWRALPGRMVLQRCGL